MYEGERTRASDNNLLDYENEIFSPKTHTFHMRCGECIITLHDAFVLLGLCVDESPLIGPTNLNWADLCGELLRVRPEEGDWIQVINVLKLRLNHLSII